MKSASKKNKPSQGSVETPAPATASPKRKTARQPGTEKKPVSRKKKAAATRSVTHPPKRAVSFAPTDAEIRMRAYFIGERRHRLGLPGDSNSDWLEAKRQLVSEVKPR